MLDFFMGLEEDGADVFCALGPGKEPGVERGGEIKVVGIVGVMLPIGAEHAVDGPLMVPYGCANGPGR